MSAIFFCGFLNVVFFLSSSASASFEFQTQGLIQKFAKESQLAPRFDEKVSFWTENKISNHLKPRAEIELTGFYEFGDLGDWNIDSRQAVSRLEIRSGNMIYLGRAHPVAELSQEESPWISHRSATGANWVQNQTGALSPYVVGWIGAGVNLFIPETSINFTVMFSPVFIPTFGPRLELSDVSSASGARFSRLPPAQLKVGEAILPLRYRLETDSIKDIVFQNQLIAGIGTTHEAYTIKVLGWTAPKPDPEIDASGILRVDSTQIDALATARASFPRQNFIGFITKLPQFFLKPELNAVFEMTKPKLTLSGIFHGAQGISFGILNSFYKESAAQVSTATTTAGYDELLTWIRVTLPEDSSWKTRPNLTVENHWKSQKRGQWWRPEVTGHYFSNLVLSLGASILVGDDDAYYGNWRSLDSVYFGAKLSF